jgi:hypothetical protein
LTNPSEKARAYSQSRIPDTLVLVPRTSYTCSRIPERSPLANMAPTKAAAVAQTAASKAALKKQQEKELLMKQLQADEAAESDSDDASDTEDAAADDVEADSESEADEAEESDEVAEKKPRRAFVDPLEIKELILLGTKGGRTKACKLLDRLSKQLEKVQAKKKAAGPRKLSAYNVFTQKHMVDVQKLESKLRMKELGQRWKKLSEKEKAKYKKLAEEANAAA